MQSTYIFNAEDIPFFTINKLKNTSENFHKELMEVPKPIR